MGGWTLMGDLTSQNSDCHKQSEIASFALSQGGILVENLA